MIELAGVSRDDVVYEPGCGDARILIAAMQAGARRGVGVDIDPDLAEVAYAKVKAAGLPDRIEIRWGNALDMDMSDATVVFLFMGEGFNKVIRPLLWRQLPVGARVVSNDFAMGDWSRTATVRVDAAGARMSSTCGRSRRRSRKERPRSSRRRRRSPADQPGTVGGLRCSGLDCRRAI